ncbi:hypothetical protein K0M31_003062 [Melipona bicolor]|uniref:Uncharacterized protein n=1 Tax=Melipona bicolor TaxID=60889 RepID=A0AA40G0Z7_9HYME|nr:hypothetical protein K0M31_003062 [Melipona bicolor]
MRDERPREQLSILCLPAGTTETGNIEIDGGTERGSTSDRRGNGMTAGGRVTVNQRERSEKEIAEEEEEEEMLEIEREKPLDGTESGHAVSVSRHSPASSFTGSIPHTVRSGEAEQLTPPVDDQSKSAFKIE